MSNGGGQVGSRAPYIIICAGRIRVALSRSGFEMIRAASDCAESFVKYFGDRLTYADTKPISDLQHAMMELVEGKATARTQASEMVDEMFAQLDALEKKMS